MSEETEQRDYEALNAKTALDLNKAQQEIERLTALVKVLGDRINDREGAEHYGPYGTNCMNTGQFDAGECWLCYAKRKKQEVEILTAQVKALESDDHEWYLQAARIERLTAELFEANLKAKTFEEGYDEMVAARDYFQADNERLRAVLKPFADAHYAMAEPNIIIDPYDHITLYDIRQAAEALAAMEEADEE